LQTGSKVERRPEIFLERGLFLWGDGYAPSPENYFDFESQIVEI